MTSDTISVFARRESEARSYCRGIPSTFSSAKGSVMTDEDGRSYIDFLAGCSSLNYGHNDPDMKAALIEHIAGDGLAHALDLHTDTKADFLTAFEKHILAPRDMDHRVMFTGPTGANAVEAAMKLARKVTGRTNIIAFTNGEEEFVDNNQNGLYDAGEVFVDLAEPFVDVNDNSTRDAGEPFTDVNGNSQWDGPNNQWDSNRLIWTETRIVEVACGVGDKATFDGGEKAGFRLISGSTNPIPDADLQLPDSVLELYVSDYNGNVIYGGTKVDLSKIGTGTLSFMYTDGTKSHTARDTYYIPWTLRHQCASGPPCNCAVEICTVESTIGPFAVPLVDSVFVGDATGGDTDPPETAGVRAVYSGISACPPGVYTYDLSVD